MKIMPQLLIPARKSACAPPCIITTLLLGAPCLAVAATLHLDFTVPSSANESNRQAVLEWNAEPARTYLVQSADDLSLPSLWKTEATVRAMSVGPIKWMAPEALSTQKFYRLILPQPEVFSVEPSFVNSDDPGALLYLTGQMLPTNGSVVINGQNFTVTEFDPDGSWIALSLSGLPPGTPIIGNIHVLDAGSNLVTTLPLQNPVNYGTELPLEQLQGPPDEPPASPSKKEFKGHVTLLKAFDDEEEDSPSAARGHTKSGHVTLLKRGDSGGSAMGKKHTKSGHVTLLKRGGDDQSAGKKEFKGHVTLLKRGDSGGSAMGKKHTKTGHVTLLKRGDSSSRTTAGWSGSDGDDVPEETITVQNSGELRCQITDLAIPGRGLDFAWTRTYRSRTETTTAQGAGWDFSYHVSATAQPDGTVILRPGNGRADTFYPDGTNGWTRDEYFLVIRDVDQDGAPDEVVFPDGGKWLLHPPGPAFTGKLAQIVDRNNNTIRCEYDTDTGWLVRVVDTLDRTNTVAYDAKGLIESVTDFSGRTVRYEYDSAADLIACISPAVIGTPNGNDFPDGKTNRYAYSSGNLDERLNHNLVSATDGLGQTWLQVNYETTSDPTAREFDRVRDYLCGTTTHFIVLPEPPTPTNGFATTRVIINDGMGNVSECYYDSRQRLVREVEFTGRANPALPTTLTDNRPTGKLRAEDPDYFETRWEWNADSLCTREIRPDGGSTEISHQRAQDHNSSRSNKSNSRAHDGNVRVVRERASSAVDTDGDGVPDTTELAWYFEYDPRFGSPVPNGVAIKTKGTGAESNRSSGGAQGWDGTIKGVGAASAKIVTDRDTGRSKGFGFVTSSTDPRGNVTTGEYDTNGNQIETVRNNLQLGSLAVEDYIENFAYNPHGQPTAITNAPDANGYRRVDTFTYHNTGPQSGYLQSCLVDAGGLALTESYEYDARGNVTRVVDPRGNDVLFTYNALDQCVTRQTQQSSFGERVKTTMHYDANDNLVRADLENRDETGALVATNPHWTTLFEHDALDRLTGIVREISEGGGLPGQYATNRFFYDGNDNLVAVHSPLAVAGSEPNNIVTNLYDERDLLFCTITAPGTAFANASEGFFDRNANLVKTQGTLSVADKFDSGFYEYDGFNRLTSARDAFGNTRQFTYDRNSNLIRVRTYGELNDVIGTNSNVRLAETRYEYDSLNRVTRSVDSFFDVFTQAPLTDGESVTAFTYAPNGQILTVTDDNAQATRYTYDTVGRLATTTDAKTNIVSYTYDECANVLSVVQTDRSDLGGNQQFATVYGYDRLHRLTRSVDNVGNTNLYAHDSRGYLTRHTDPKGNIQQFTVSGTGRTTGHIADLVLDGILDPNTDAAHTYTYDVNDRCVAATDPNGNGTLYAYDERNRCVSITEADGTAASFVWSPRSNLILHQDANGTVISNSFDLLDRCVRRDITPGATVASTTTFETFAYDGFSRCVAASNDVSLATFAYDSLGHTFHATQDGLTTTGAHDGVGNRLTLTYPSGRTVTSTYDALNQVASLSSSSGGLPPASLATYSYDGPGKLARIARANNVNTRLLWNGTANPANSPGDFGWQQVSSINHQLAGGGTVIDRRVASYDRNQNKTTRTQTAAFAPGGPTSTNLFAYDALDRLTTFTRGSGAPDDLFKTHELDRFGNRVSTVLNGLPAGYFMDSTFPDPADYQRNQYTFTPFVLAPEQYDENGNLVGRVSTSGAELVYQYDYADRLVAVADLQTGLLEPIASYAYDALGRRISKTIYPGGLPPVTTQFTYSLPDEDSDGDIIEERVSGTLRRTYAFPQRFDQAGRVMFTDGGETYYFHADELGNTLALTDASGTVVERYDYDDFGAPYFLSVDGFPTGEVESGVGNPYGWLGLRLDAETGLYNDDGGGYFDPHPARDIALPKITPKLAKESHGKFRTSNNPWSGGSPVKMKKGTVKFFNEPKGFGFVGAGGEGGTKAQDHNSSRSNKSGTLRVSGGGKGKWKGAIFRPSSGEWSVSGGGKGGGKGGRKGSSSGPIFRPMEGER